MRVSATSGWHRATASSARGSHAISTTRPAPTAAFSHPARVRGKRGRTKGCQRARTSGGAAPKSHRSVLGLFEITANSQGHPPAAVILLEAVSHPRSPPGAGFPSSDDPVEVRGHATVVVGQVLTPGGVGGVDQFGGERLGTTRRSTAPFGSTWNGADDKLVAFGHGVDSALAPP